MLTSQGTAPLSNNQFIYFLSLSLSSVSQRSENKSDSNFEREGREVIKKIFENLSTETELAVALENVSG